MNLGEVNKGAVALILALLIGAGGYLWWSQMYTPAVEARTAAVAAESTAQGGLTAAKQELAAAEERIEQARSEAGKLDDSVGKVAISRKAIPSEKLIDDAAIVLMDLAERSGVSTTFSSPDEMAAGVEGSGASGATPIDLTFAAAGTYSEMMLFMSLVEDTVIEKDGKLYTRDRLFNVVSLQIGSPEGEDSESGSFEGSGSGDANGPIMQRGDMLFTVVVRMYTSSTENSAGVGEQTPDDPAAAPVEGGAAGATGGAPGATGTEGDGTAAPGATPATDPNATGTPDAGNPTTNGEAAPAASGGF